MVYESKGQGEDEMIAKFVFLCLHVQFSKKPSGVPLPWVPEVFSRVQRSREKKRAGHFLRLDRNRKPRMQGLWHPG